MKKRELILLMTTLAILIFSLVNIKYTGLVSKEPQIQFYFYEEDTLCPLEGYVLLNNKLIGKSIDGIFILAYQDYKLEVENKSSEVELIGKLGKCYPQNPDLFINRKWSIPEINKDYFIGESSFDFKTSIKPNNPSQKEFIGFIQPDKIKDELKKIKFENNSLNDISKINQHLSESIKYLKDWDFNKENYWQIPEETIEKKQGDCEDYEVLLLSLILAYKSELNCYNIILTSHVTTLCYEENNYVYYDQEKIELKLKHDSDEREDLENFQKEYYKHYGINNSETTPRYAFNKKELVEFNNLSEFIEWEYNLKNKDKKQDIFEELEERLNYKEILLSPNGITPEKKTQTVNIYSEKISFYLIILITVILATLITVFWIIKRR